MEFLHWQGVNTFCSILTMQMVTPVSYTHLDVYKRQAFGTYYASLYGNEEPCEMANVKAPTRVAAIHEEYLLSLIHI